MEDTIRGIWHSDNEAAARRLQPFAVWVRHCVNAVRDFFQGMSDFEIVRLILLINLIVVALYLLFHLWKKRWKKGLLLSVFMLAMPVVGPLYLLFGELLQAIQKLFGNRTVSMEELSFDQSRVRMILDADVEKERNVVPVEEALLVSDKQDKRVRFLEILKQKQTEPLSTIRSAVENEDSEIAHYAAAYVTDTISRVKEREMTLRKAFEENPTLENCEAYTQHLRKAMEMNVFEGAEWRRYLERLEQSYFWQNEKTSRPCSVRDMAGIARQWMKLGDIQSAGRWIDRLRPRCYEDLDAFKACAVYDYRRGDRADLMELLENVRGSALELDSEALDWIRFFDRSA